MQPSPRIASSDFLEAGAPSNPWTARYRRLYAHEDSLKTVRTLTEHLLYMNDPDRIRVGHGAYLVGGFKLGPEAEYLGVDDATSWYNSNLRIFSNLQHMTSGSAERILLIIEAGHLPFSVSWRSRRRSTGYGNQRRSSPTADSESEPA